MSSNRGTYIAQMWQICYYDPWWMGISGISLQSPKNTSTPRILTLLLGCDSKFRCAYFYAGCGGLFLPTLLFLSAGVYFW